MLGGFKEKRGSLNMNEWFHREMKNLKRRLSTKKRERPFKEG